MKPADRLWAEGVPAPVPAVDAFAQMLGQEPVGEIDLTLVDIDEPAAARAADESPYRPPLAALEDRGESEVRYAGFWVRFAANLLDAIILGALGAGGLRARHRVGGGRCGAGQGGVDHFVVGLMVGWLYVALGESGPASATWGKRAFNLHVLGADRLDRISFLRATGRLAGPLPLHAAVHDRLPDAAVQCAQAGAARLPVRYRGGGRAPVFATRWWRFDRARRRPAFRYRRGRCGRRRISTMSCCAKVSAALRQVTPATVAIQRFLAAQGHAPASLAEAGFDTRKGITGVRRLEYDPARGVITVMLDVEQVRGSTVLIVPNQIENDAISWRCQAGTLPPRWLPRQCPPGA